jgi:hypothetical protein
MVIFPGYVNRINSFYGFSSRHDTPDDIRFPQAGKIKAKNDKIEVGLAKIRWI